MSGFELLVLGVGDTFTARHATTAVLLSCDGFHLAIDCPDRYLGVLAAAAGRAGSDVSVADVDHVLITHLHGDHVNGLEGLAFYKRFAEGKRLSLIATQEGRAAIWDERLKAPMSRLWDGTAHREMHFEDYFDFTPLSWSEVTTIGPFRIRARPTIHHLPTSALLVEAQGRMLGWSSDTAYDPGLIEWLSQADLIVHETNLGPAHTPYEKLAALPEALRAKMRLNHYPDFFDAEASAIPVLREGDLLAI